MFWRSVDRRSISFLELPVNVLHHIFVTPKFNYLVEKEPYGKNNYIRFIIFIILIISGYAYMFFYRFKTISQAEHKVLKNIIFVVIVADCMGFANVFFTIKQAVFQHEPWKRLFTEMKDIEILLSNYFLKSPEFNICFFLAMYFLFYTIMEPGIKCILYLVTAYNYLMIHIVALLLVNLVLSVRLKYKDTNTILITRLKEMDSNFINFIGDMKKIIRKINKTVVLINDIFKYQTFAHGLYFGSNIIFTVLYIQSPVQHKILSGNLAEVWFSVGYGVFYITSNLGEILSTTYCCDIAVRNAKSIAVTCQQLKMTFPGNSQEYFELEHLEDVARNEAPPFLVGNCLQINRGTMFALFGTYCSYLIVLIQFLNEETVEIKFNVKSG